MARSETDKEDLMAEATALVDRIEISTDGDTACFDIITLGYRRNGHLSIYFDQDPFYQFDEHGFLRRAWSDGRLLRSQQTTLAAMVRVRTPDQTILQRTDLSGEELHEFRSRMQTLVKQLEADLAEQRYRILRIVSEDEGFVAGLPESLRQILSKESDFLSAGIRAGR